MASNHKNAYPHFVPNQLLKSSTLNGYFAFLDEQTRLSRVHFLGCGIVEGLDFSIADGTLVIYPGVAANKDGWLVQVPEETVYKFAVGVAFSSTPFISDQLKSLLEMGGSRASYICFPTEDDAKQYDSDKKRIVPKPISELELKDYVVALAFGKRPEYQGRCVHDHSDVNTADEILEAWPVLIPVGGREAPSLFQRMSPFQGGVSSKKEPAFEYYHGDVGSFNDQIRSSAISWQSEIIRVMEMVSSHFDKLDQTALDHVFTDSGKAKTGLNDAKKRIQGLVDPSSQDVPDYMISFFSDLATALNEFIDSYNAFVGKYRIIPNVLPEDLLIYLGRVAGDRKDRDIYRSVFRNAMKEEFRKDCKRLSRLLQRVCILTDSFIEKPTDKRILQKAFELEKVRPSGGLSSRPVPFYYDTSKEGFYEAWNADKDFVEEAYDDIPDNAYSNQYLSADGSMNEEGWCLYPRAYQGKDPSAIKNALEMLNRNLRLSMDIAEVGLNEVVRLPSSDADVLLKFLDTIPGVTSKFFEDVQMKCTGNTAIFDLCTALGSAFDAQLVKSLRDGLPLTDKKYREICTTGEITEASVSKMSKEAIDITKKKTITDKALSSAYWKLIDAWKMSFVSVAKEVKQEEIGKAVSLAPIKRGCRVLLFSGPGGNAKDSRTVLSYGVIYQSDVIVSEETVTYGFKMRTKVSVKGDNNEEITGVVYPFSEGARWDRKDNQLVLYPYVSEGSSSVKYKTDKSNIECTSSDQEVLKVLKIDYIDKDSVPVVVLKMVGNGTAWVNLMLKDAQGKSVQRGFSVNVNNPEWNIINVTRVIASSSSSEPFVDDTVQLSAEVKPDDASNPDVGWEPKDPSSVKIYSNGLAKVLKEGRIEIKAFARADESIYDTVILQASSLCFRMRALRKDGTSFYADIPKKEFNPFEPMKDGSTWDCFNDQLVICPFKNTGSSVDPYLVARTNLSCEFSGEQALTSKQEAHPDFGSGSVTVLGMSKTDNGKKVKATLRVIQANNVILSQTIQMNIHNPEWDKKRVTDVWMPSEEPEMLVGQKKQLTAKVIPENADDREMKWDSSTKGVATVVETTGEVTAHRMGNTIISVVTNDGSFTTSRKLYVSSLLFRGDLKNSTKGDGFDTLPDTIQKDKWGDKTFMKIFPYKKVDNSRVKKGESTLVPLSLDKDNLVVVSGCPLTSQVVTDDGKVPYVKLYWGKKGEHELTVQVKDPEDPDNILLSKTFTVKI